jgi:UDP-2-acetamido-2,6-beta-L-arabino-hexul-4-ose reductase
MVRNLKILITGSRGFIGKNLSVRFNEMGVHDVLTYNRDDNPDVLPSLIEQSDVIVHLAGEMRPIDNSKLFTVNVGLTERICTIIKNTNKKKILILTSSIQADQDNPYGLSKLQAEQAVIKLSNETGNQVVIFRLPHVFGKWCKPNYNSVIATFCYNISRGLPIHISDPNAIIRPVHIDDVVLDLIGSINQLGDGYSLRKVSPEYEVTIGDLANVILGFKKSRVDLVSDKVGIGFIRALYSTYISYLAADNFSYLLPKYSDERGVFVEFLKTLDSGQFSYFTALPNVTRGEHYHHTKTEKFLVVSGKARFCFRNIITNEKVEILTSSQTPQMVESIPGWAHSITNVGEHDMVVMLWANERFNSISPDTIPEKI